MENTNSKKNDNNIKKPQKTYNKRKLIVSIIVIIALLLTMLNIINNNERINNILGISKKQENEQILPLVSYIVYDNKNEEKIKTLITVNSDKGIEYVEYPNGEKLYGNEKNVVTIDYETRKGETYIFNIKEKGENAKEERITVTNETIKEYVNVEKISENTGYKTIEISSNSNINGFKTYYKIGKSEEWIEGKGKISILDYDLTENNLINDDETVTISAMLKNNETEDTVLISENYKVDTSSTLSSFEADSLLQAIEKYDFGTGKYKVSVEEATYSLKVYSFDENLEIKSDTQFGTEEDVGAENKYAQNMIVVKVNGDLTIDQGVTLTSHASKTGHGGPKGMMIYCTGTLTNNGTISMSARGAYAEGQNVYLWKNADESYEYVPAVGGAGGTIPSYKRNSGTNGKNGTIRQTGGGGSGGVGQWDYPPSGSGAAGTSYSGGSGGGGRDASVSGDRKGNAGLNGGAGGNGSNFFGGQNAGGGAGNPGGMGYTMSSGNGYGENGTGGLLIIYGNDIQNNSNIISNGSNGQNWGIPGESSGGGSINIFYRKNWNGGNVNAHGGQRAGNYGGAGGEGSISIGNISTGTYESTDKNY